LQCLRPARTIRGAMELHQLRYVVAVARTKNFSRAAEQCHVSQPSLSQQVQKLEDELGEKLFERLKREVKVTAAGEAFLRRAERILDEVDAARREVTDGQALLRGTLAIGALPTIAPYLLPEVIVRFNARYPGVEVVLHEDTTARLLKLALACDIDFAVVSRPLHEPRVAERELFDEELLLAVAPGHRLAAKRVVAPRDLDGEKLIVMKESHCLGDQVLNFCERRGTHPQVSIRSAQMQTVQALVRAGVGLSLIPRMAVMERRVDAPVYRSFTAPVPRRSIVAAWPEQRPLSRAASEFLKEIARSEPAPR
jgi:LysR family transcriptional regulator, hydrogen peroxide-inducible genes activator